MKVTIIEGPLAKKARRNASIVLTQIIKKEIDRVGESELRRVVSN